MLDLIVKGSGKVLKREVYVADDCLLLEFLLDEGLFEFVDLVE